MKKVFTATACIWKSYGSILQAMGLQKKLGIMGYENTILKCEAAPNKELNRSPLKAHTLKRLVVNIHKMFIYSKLNRRYQNTNKFMQENLDITYCKSYENLLQSSPQADAYIAGSDQIWNPQNMRPFFYLDFAEPGVRRVAYAASMGVTKLPQEKEKQFKQYVSRFDYISVREQDNVPIVRQYTDKPISVHIDPVFLLEREAWRSYEECYPGLDTPYVLVFAIYWDKKLNRQLMQLQKDTGVKIVAVCGSLQHIYANKRIYDADPSQFLWLIDHAEAVVSSSFHGVSMAILFNKRLSAVINPSAPSRLMCLLNTLNIDNLPIGQLFSDKKIDYSQVNEKIKEERLRSEAYLREALAGI